MDQPFCYRLRVRYGECDAQKVVFNVQYGNYIDLSVLEFLRSLGYEESLVDGTFDYQLVKQTIEWMAPARFDSVLEVSVSTARLGTTSFTMLCEFRIAGQDRVICRGETVYVLVDNKTLTKKPLSPELRAALERGSPNRCIDHADCTVRTRSTE